MNYAELEQKTVDQLRTMAKDRDIPDVGGLRKAALITKILLGAGSAPQASSGQGSDRPGEGGAGADTVSAPPLGADPATAEPTALAPGVTSRRPAPIRAPRTGQSAVNATRALPLVDPSREVEQSSVPVDLPPATSTTAPNVGEGQATVDSSVGSGPPVRSEPRRGPARGGQTERRADGRPDR